MLRQIRYFQSVVRNNSFSEAAEECHISQSAISQQIKALEQELALKKQTLSPVLELSDTDLIKKILKKGKGLT